MVARAPTCSRRETSVAEKQSPNQIRRIEELQGYVRTMDHVKKLVAELESNRAAKATIINGICGNIARELSHMRQRALTANLGTPWRDGAAGRALRERLGIQLQETQLADKLTVEETLTLFRSFYRQSHTVDEVLALVELEEKRKARVVTLSGGQKQRLAVACALVSKPELLFLDEPTTGLDPQSRRQLWEIIRRFRAAGGTVLLTTHYMEEAERLCDRVAIMDHGRVIALGTPAQLIASLGADQIIEFSVKGEMDEARLAALAGVRGAHAR